MKTIFTIIFSVVVLYAGVYDYPYLVHEKSDDIETQTDKHLMYDDFEKIIRFEPVFFDPSTNMITEDSDEYLQTIIKSYKKHQDKKILITIIGYTDHVQTKTEKANQSWWFPIYQNDLTESSAQEIALSYANYTYEQFLNAGISKDIMIVEQRGGLDNLYTNATSEGQELNYRAMVTFYIEKDPNTDGDKDGIVDSKDQCKFTPIGHPVDKNGCSEILNLTVYYDVNSPKIKEVSLEKLAKVIAFMNKYPTFKVLLYGHTSSEGTSLENQVLSEKRALGVRKYLISQGINSSRISAYGKASSEPVQDKNVKEIYELNRRVEIKLY